MGSNDDQYPSPYINDKGDLIIPDTFAFRPHGHEDNKLVQAISNIAGALGGDKEKVQNWAATKIDSSLGAFIPNIPGQDDPIVHFQTVIPKNQLTQIQNKFQQIADTAKRKAYSIDDPVSPSGEEKKKKVTEAVSPKRKLKRPQEFFNQADIKPEYPENPPPDMVNNKHPDLVDGKKIAKRFNRLDPTSARAMPKTGNPHIDKKIVAARKKPK